MAVVVGGVIEKNGKYLLVQEAQKECYGKWNLPAGRLDFNESIVDGAIREVKEETNCDIEVTGICQVGNRLMEDSLFLTVVFQTRLLSDDIKFNTDEILSVKWFSYEEILAMEESLRSPDFIVNAIKNCCNDIVGSLELLQLIK